MPPSSLVVRTANPEVVDGGGTRPAHEWNTPTQVVTDATSDDAFKNTLAGCGCLQLIGYTTSTSTR